MSFLERGHITPVLEERLANSPAVGYTGDLKLSFYRAGAKLSFEKGRLKESMSYIPEVGEDGDVLFPDLTFLRVLFGYTDFDDLDAMFPDCSARNDHGRALVKALFPQRPSNLWPVS